MRWARRARLGGGLGFSGAGVLGDGRAAVGGDVERGGGIVGTPEAGTRGSYPITITAANGVVENATQSFTLTVDVAPAITSGDGSDVYGGLGGLVYGGGIGFPAPAFSETGALPAGVTLSAAGVLSGRRSSTGGELSDHDHGGKRGVAQRHESFTLTVDQAPVITSGGGDVYGGLGGLVYGGGLGFSGAGVLGDGRAAVGGDVERGGGIVGYAGGG